MFGQSAKNVLVAAHRGYRAKYPENTMLAFRKADALGVDMLEMDLNLTKDKRLAVIHDDTVDRTTDGSGAVRDYTFRELQELDAGGWFGAEFAGLQIPSFTEFLDWAAETNLYLNVEIKERTAETVDLAVREIERRHMRNRCLIACFDADITRYAAEKHGMKTQGFPSWYMSNFQDDSYSFMYSAGIEMGDLNRALCEEFRARGIDPWCWCPDDEAAVYKTIESGASLCTCNDPLPALTVLRRENLRKAVV
jgi:glycerophosphoryl diester phosphodiesterase